MEKLLTQKPAFGSSHIIISVLDQRQTVMDHHVGHCHHAGHKHDQAL